MKILIAVPLLSGIGGIQSSLLNLLGNISLYENDVSLCVFGNYISESTHISERIKVIRGPKILEYCLRDFHTSYSYYSWYEKIPFIFIKLLRRLFGYKIILHLALYSFNIDSSFDVAISYANDIYGKSFMGGANDIIKKCVDAKRKIAWIHNDPRKLGFKYKICKRTYEDFDYIVNVSYACKKIFDEIIPEFETKSKVVYNIIDIDKVRKLAKEYDPFDHNIFNIVTVARIDNKQKRIERVLACCKKLKADGIINFKWYIVGDGPDKERLEIIAKGENLRGNLMFVGFKNNPYPYIKNADLLVMTSDYESNSMVLKESLAFGTPIVCTNFPSASEVIIDNKNGMLVDRSSDGIYYGIKKVMNEISLIDQWRNNISKQECDNELALKQFWNVVRNSND